MFKSFFFVLFFFSKQGLCKVRWERAFVYINQGYDKLLAGKWKYSLSYIHRMINNFMSVVMKLSPSYEILRLWNVMLMNQPLTFTIRFLLRWRRNRIFNLFLSLDKKTQDVAIRMAYVGNPFPYKLTVSVSNRQIG